MRLANPGAVSYHCGGKRQLYRSVLRQAVERLAADLRARAHGGVTRDLELGTARYLGDPEQFWRLCDANAALRPDELMEVGRWLRITLPEGIPGIPNA